MDSRPSSREITEASTAESQADHAEIRLAAHSTDKANDASR
jgi:hypothetical protein